MAKKSVIKALREISEGDPTPDHFKAFRDEVRAERNDRGAAILLATNIENALDSALRQFLDPKYYDSLGAMHGPLGSFSSKILMGRALSIYGEVTFKNLDTIRHIRNAFAHSKIPINFATPEVRAACGVLTILAPVPPHTVKDPAIDPNAFEGRERYQDVCEVIAHNLIWATLRAIDRIDRAALKPEVKLDDRLELLVRPKPLP